LFSLVPEHLYATLFIFVDTAIAALIALIYAHLWTPRNVTKDALNVVAAYYLNPLVVLTCVSHSITAINNLCLIACLFLALRQKHLLALFFLASATYLSLYPIILLPPILLILSRSTPFGAFSGIIIFAGWLIALFGLTFMQMTGSLPVEMLWSSVDGLNLQDAALAVVGNTGRFLHSLPVQNGWRLYQTFLNSIYGFM
jgi:hypothetical protein